MQSLSGGAGALIEFLGRYVRELGGGNDKDKSEAQGGGGGKIRTSKAVGGRSKGVAVATVLARILVNFEAVTDAVSNRELTKYFVKNFEHSFVHLCVLSMLLKSWPGTAAADDDNDYDNTGEIIHIVRGVITVEMGRGVDVDVEEVPGGEETMFKFQEGERKAINGQYSALSIVRIAAEILRTVVVTREKEKYAVDSIDGLILDVASYGPVLSSSNKKAKSDALGDLFVVREWVGGVLDEEGIRMLRKVFEAEGLEGAVQAVSFS